VADPLVRSALACTAVLGFVAYLAQMPPRAGPLPARAGPAADAPAAAALLFDRPLDLNAACAEDLAGLPGIGAVRAQRIVERRRARGGFTDVAQLLEVPGIGKATLARVRPLLEVR
jgi:competence protein ComEA